MRLIGFIILLVLAIYLTGVSEWGAWEAYLSASQSEKHALPQAKIESSCVCPTSPTCPTEPPAQSCPAQPPCPTLGACPSCPELAIPGNISSHLLNLCKETISPNGAPAVSDGCFKAEYAALDLLGLKHQSKFWEGPPRENYKAMYDGQIYLGNSYSNLSASVFMFSRDDGYHYGRSGLGFFLNHTKWRWNNTISSVVVWNITENFTDSWVESNMTDDLWVQLQ